ncbi:hypothetical protein F5888DRAFT_1671977 [Russula emetica]|nr:hypothetical protein F5888DRAFT_1671977 [Russula emetica]
MDTSGAQATEGGIPGFAPFDPGEKAAAIALFLVALLSTLVLSFVLLCVGWIVSRSFSSNFKRTPYQDLSREAFFFRSQLGQYATCLLLSNWIRAVSGTIDINWISGGGVKAGTSCIAQGSMRQIGEYASFFFIVAMGIHTFNTLVLRNRPPHWLGIVVTATGWVSAVIIGVAPVSVTSEVNGPFYNSDGLTCDISRSYGVAHMCLYFLPLFLASFLSVILYSLIFLTLRGTIVFNAGLRIHINPERRLRPRNDTFEEYQRFVYSVARTMLWLPISSILVLLPSSIVELMDISGITVSPGVMALSCILERLDGVINVVILFNVLGTLSPAVKSSYSTDSEKGHLGQVTISRPLKDTKSLSRFSSEIQGPVTKSATPARLPGASYVSSLTKSLLRFHKKTRRTSSSTHMLIREPPSRSHSPTSSLERSESSSSTLPVMRPIPPALNTELSVPPEAVQKSTQPVPQISHLRIDLPSQHGKDFTGLSPPPRGKWSRNSRDPRPISGPPTLPIVPILEVTLCSPTTSPTEGGVGSLINMYISSDAIISAELPPFPDTAVHRDSSSSLPLSTSPSGWPATRLPAALDLPVTVAPKGIGSSPLKAAVSIGAVGGGHAHLPPPTPPPKLLSARATSSAGATDGSQHSDSEGDAPLSSEVSAARDTKASAQSGASREGQSSVQNHPEPRTLPLSRSLLSHAQRAKLHKVPSSSSRYGYL